MEHADCERFRATLISVKGSLLRFLISFSSSSPQPVPTSPIVYDLPSPCFMNAAMREMTNGNRSDHSDHKDLRALKRQFKKKEGDTPHSKKIRC